MAKLRRLVYAMNMNGLETAASATLSICVVPFLMAWDAGGEGARKYRRTVKKFLYFSLALVTTPAGILVNIVMLALAPFDPRPLKNMASLKSYQYRRRYRGRHYDGVAAYMLIARAASGDNCHAMAS